MGHGLPFMDNSIVFCELDEEQLGYLGGVLICYEAIYKVEINITKSNLISAGEVQNRHIWQILWDLE